MTWDRSPRPAEERFLEKIEVDPDTGCWNWTAGLAWGGYGSFTVKHGRKIVAHRWAYQHWIEPVSDELDLDHFVCENRRCANPHHVRPASRRENTLRGPTLAARKRAQTHCIHGHPFDEVNTYHWRGHRLCKTCMRERKRRYAHGMA